MARQDSQSPLKSPRQIILGTPLPSQLIIYFQGFAYKHGFPIIPIRVPSLINFHILRYNHISWSKNIKIRLKCQPTLGDIQCAILKRWVSLYCHFVPLLVKSFPPLTVVMEENSGEKVSSTEEEETKICRTCLTQEGEFQSVFVRDEDSGYDIHLAEMIMSYASVQV